MSIVFDREGQSVGGRDSQIDEGRAGIPGIGHEFGEGNLGVLGNAPKRAIQSQRPPLFWFLSPSPTLL